MRQGSERKSGLLDAMDEAKVVFDTYEFLKKSGLTGRKLPRLYVDAHKSLVASNPKFANFQRITLRVNGKAIHPDLVGVLDDGRTLVAVEAKGMSVGTGLAQAQSYQQGFHLTYLALPEEKITDKLLKEAQESNVGIISVGTKVAIQADPTPLKLDERLLMNVRGQLSLTAEFQKKAFGLNFPTHYFVAATLFDSKEGLKRKEIHQKIRESGWVLEEGKTVSAYNHLINGAQRLGFIYEDGRRWRLSITGESVRSILDYSIDKWTIIHKDTKKKRDIALIDVDAPAGHLLQLLMLREDIVQLVCRSLKRLNGYSSLVDLARACEEEDPALCYATFLDGRRYMVEDDSWGSLNWKDVPNEAFRTSITLQFKRLMHHGGIIHPTKLRSKLTDPNKDFWSLRLEI